MDNYWVDYLEKLRQVSLAVKQTAYFTKQAGNYAIGAAYYAQETVDNVRKYLDKKGEK